MNKNVKRATIVLAMTPLMSMPAVGAFAATGAGSALSTATATVQQGTGATTTTTTTTDAPPASASAVAAKVDGVITVGETGATASSSGTTAHAHALDLFGTTVSGDDAKTGETKDGSIFSTPDNPLGDLELAPYHAKAGQTQSEAEASLAHAGLLGVLQIWLLHSSSNASWSSTSSVAHAQSDGAEVNLADQLDVKVLHAETDSSGKGSSAVLVINDQGILTSDQTGNACVIDADPLATLLCLQATGGQGKGGTTSSTAEVLSETSGVGIPGATVVGSTSGGGKVASAQKPATSTTHHARRPSGATSGSTGGGARLPFTGSEAGLLALYGAVLTGLGAAITTVARRRRVGLA